MASITARTDKLAQTFREDMDREIPVIEQVDLSLAIANELLEKQSQNALEEAKNHKERGEILTEVVIDPHEGRLATIISYWETLTPSRCDYPRCSFDAAKAIGFKDGWDSIDELMYVGKTNVRDFAIEKLAQHKAIKHSIEAPKHIRTAEEARAARGKIPAPDTFIENPRLI